MALASFVSQRQSRSTREMQSGGRCCTANWCVLFELEVGSKCRVQPLSCPLGLRWKEWKSGCCGRPAGRSCRIARIGSRVPMQHRKMARLGRSGRRNRRPCASRNAGHVCRVESAGNERALGSPACRGAGERNGFSGRGNQAGNSVVFGESRRAKQHSPLINAWLESS